MSRIYSSILLKSLVFLCVLLVGGGRAEENLAVRLQPLFDIRLDILLEDPLLGTYGLKGTAPIFLGLDAEGHLRSVQLGSAKIHPQLTTKKEDGSFVTKEVNEMKSLTLEQLEKERLSLKSGRFDFIGARFAVQEKDTDGFATKFIVHMDIMKFPTYAVRTHLFFLLKRQGKSWTVALLEKKPASQLNEFEVIYDGSQDKNTHLGIYKMPVSNKGFSLLVGPPEFQELTQSVFKDDLSN